MVTLLLSNVSILQMKHIGRQLSRKSSAVTYCLFSFFVRIKLKKLKVTTCESLFKRKITDQAIHAK